jgi:hypothetical protein
MALEFVNALADLLDKKAKGDLRSKLAEYAGYLSPGLAAIPFVGSGIEGISSKALEGLSQRPPWHVQFEGLADEIEGMGKRVLFVVDDVDRLQVEELLALLKVIRLLGRFKGVHYLIAYDQQTIEELLGGAGRSRLSSFMEKIVQYPFEVPAISEGTALRLVNESISMLLRESGTSVSDTGLQRSVELASILVPEIKTPRSLGRFREQLRAFAPHVREAELDPLDYIAATWLRLAVHEVWLQLPRWNEELRSGTERQSLTVSKDLKSADWLKRIEAVQPEQDSLPALRLLSFLYSPVDVFGMSSYVAHDRALSDPNYFGRYLLLAMPEDDVSDDLVRESVEALIAGTPDGRVTEFAKVLDGGADKANLALAKAGKLRRPVSETSKELLAFLAGRMRARKDDEPRVGAPSNSLRLWAAQECGRAIRDGVASADEIIDWFGEEESFAIALRISGNPEFRSNKKSILEGFAHYWAKVVPGRMEELLADGSKLGSIAELISFADDPTAPGLLDFAVSSFDDYVRVAKAFVKFDWSYGGADDVEYELIFRGDAFFRLLSPAVHDRYRAAVESEAGEVDYEVEDLLAPEVTEEVRRAFAIDSVATRMKSNLPDVYMKARISAQP